MEVADVEIDTKPSKELSESSEDEQLAQTELLAVDYYEGIKSLYCSDQFSKDEAGWEALINRAWADALAQAEQRRRRVRAAGGSVLH